MEKYQALAIGLVGLLTYYAGAKNDVLLFASIAIVTCWLIQFGVRHGHH